MSSDPIPQWQLPTGVSRGTWDYLHATHIADDYDAFFAYNQLFELDEQVVARYFHPPGLVADLGCGTGRALIPLVRRGCKGLAVDLSAEMLRNVREKLEAENLAIECLQANLCELDPIADASVDYAMCLFSTLGMVKGRENRQKVLAHVRRMLKPGGLFVLHVHNYWFNVYDPGGPWWFINSYLRSWYDKQWEAGDKYFEYRAIPNMYLHVFTRRELRRALRTAGFDIIEWIPLDVTRNRPLRAKWLAEGLRANGWIVVCRKGGGDAA